MTRIAAFVSHTPTGRRAAMRATLQSQTSRRALRPLLAATTLVLGSGLLAAPAHAECAISGPDLICDGNTGATAIDTVFGFESVTFLNGQVLSHQSGFQVIVTGIAGADFAMDEASSITSTANSALTLVSTSTGGPITSTTPYGSGINGNLFSRDNFGLVATTTGANGSITLVQGANSTISGRIGGIRVTTAGANAPIDLTLNGLVQSRAGTGLEVNTQAASAIVRVNGRVEGVSPAILGTSISGDIEVVVGAGGSADGAIGVGLSTTSGSLTVRNAGTIEGGVFGVALSSSGTGAVGPISIVQTGTGTIRVKPVAGAAGGVFMTSIDADQIVTGNGGSTTIDASNGTVGVSMLSTGTGSIRFSSNTVLGRTGGFQAQQTGAANRGIEVDGIGNITTTSGTGVLLLITNAANSGNISYLREGNVSGDTGIRAEITQGSGSIALVSHGDITAGNGSAINALIADTRATNGSILVKTTAGDVITASNGQGIVAINRAGGAGSLDVNNAADVRVSGGIGIALSRSNGDGTTTLTNTGSIRSGAGGPGTLNIGLFASANTGADGTVTINHSGADIGAANDRAQEIGIYADSRSGVNTGNVAVNIANASVFSSGDGVRALHFGTGSITVTGTGTGTVDSSADIGINAQKIGTSAGDVTVNVTQNVRGQLIGIVGLNAGLGSVSVTSAGNVSAMTREGINAQTRNAAGSGFVLVNANGTTSGTRGVVALNAGSGSIQINANSDVTGTAGEGIQARLTSATGHSNDVGVNVAAGATVAGTGDAGIFVDMGNSRGIANVTLNGRATGTTGVSQLAFEASLGLTVGSTGRADGDIGVVQFNGVGNNAILNNGVIQGSDIGISQLTFGPNISVTNNGTITGGNRAIDADMVLGSYVLTNNTSGIINGSIRVAGTDSSTSRFVNAGTWNASGTSLFNGVWTNSGTTNVASGATISSPQLTTNTASGTIRFAGNGGLATSLANLGLIDARNGLAGQVISLNGQYSGGGTIGLDAAIGSNTADRFAIAGNATGTTNVAINVLNRAILPGGFLPLITVGGTAAAGAFTSTTTLPRTGVFTESFGVNPANAREFGIIQSFNPGSVQLGQLSSVAGPVSAMVGEPLGEVVSARGDRKVQLGLWGRGGAGSFDQDLLTTFGSGPWAVAVNARARTSYHLLQSGLDVGLIGLGDSGIDLHLGVTGGHWGASSKGSVGLTTISADFLGGYAVVRAGGFTLDASLRKEWRDFRLDNALLIANGRVSTEGESTAGSVGASWQLGLGKHFYLKPAASYAWGSNQIDAFAIDPLTMVTPGKDNTGYVRYGATMGWEGQVSPDLVLAPQVGVFAVHNTSRASPTAIGWASSAMDTTTTAFADTLQIVAGIELHDTDNQLGAFVKASGFTSGGVSGASVNVGARINF